MLSNEGSELLRIPEKSALLCFSLDRPQARSIVFRHTPIPDIALGCLECSVQLRLRPKKNTWLLAQFTESRNSGGVHKGVSLGPNVRRWS